MELCEISTLGFIREFREVTSGMHPRKFCFVLGAGASLSSGIPSGQKLVNIWDAELRDRNPEEHERWKQKLGITDANRAEFYSQYYEARFPISMDGYAYMENIMEQASPSAGYAALAYLLCNSDNNIVLTTNFDRLAEDAVNRHQRKYPLVIGHEALAHYIADDAKRPVVIKIHRDLLMDPKSKQKEIDHLDDRWEEHLEKVFSNYHPVFVGYAGNDKSLMGYLIKNSGKVQNGAWKLPYWTLYGKEHISGKAREFMEAAGGYVIRNCDFDELMIRLGDARGYKLRPEEDVVSEARAENKGIRKKMEEVLEKALKPELPEKAGGTAVVTTSEESPSKAGASEADAAEEAAKELNEAVGRITGDTDSASRWERRWRANQAYNRGDFETAARLERQLVEEEPENAEYHHNLAVTLHAMKRYEEALKERKRAVELEPENALYHNQLGITLHEMKRYEEAEAEKRRAVELEPENAEYHYSRGVTLHKMKRYEEAEAESRRAVELEPGNAEYHDSLSTTLHKMERYEEAEAETRRALELEPENAEYHCSLGVTLHAMKRYEEAEAEKRRAAELEPENAEYHWSLGVTLHAMKRYEEAEAETRRALELEPENAKYHRSLGVTLREMKRYDEALAETNKAIELAPKDPKNYNRLALLYRAMGKPGEAERAEAKEKELEAKRAEAKGTGETETT